MDFLLKLLTPRRLGAAAIGCCALAVGIRHRQTLKDYAPYIRPSVAPPDRLGLEISEAREQSEKRRVEIIHRTVAAELSLARSEGFDVSLLELKAQEALRLNIGPTRRAALKMLAEIGMALPRKPARQGRPRP